MVPAPFVLARRAAADRRTASSTARRCRRPTPRAPDSGKPFVAPRNADRSRRSPRSGGGAARRARRHRRQLLRARRRLDPQHPGHRALPPARPAPHAEAISSSTRPIAQLAAGRRPRPPAVRAPRHRPLTGTVPLTPIQRWFFEQRFAGRAPLEPGVPVRGRRGLRRGTRSSRRSPRCCAHHDALRLRFAQDAGRRGRSATATPTPICASSASTSRDVPAASRPPRSQTHATRAQATLDLADGPLLRAVHFDLGAAARRPRCCSSSITSSSTACRGASCSRTSNRLYLAARDGPAAAHTRAEDDVDAAPGPSALDALTRSVVRCRSGARALARGQRSAAGHCCRRRCAASDVGSRVETRRASRCPKRDARAAAAACRRRSARRSTTCC